MFVVVVCVLSYGKSSHWAVFSLSVKIMWDASGMYKKEDFFYVNYKDLDDKYKPYFRQLFGFDSSATSERYLEKTNTFVVVEQQIKANGIHHIFQRINMFFMFKDQYAVIEHRYLRKNRNGDIVETPWELEDWVATFVALSDPKDQHTYHHPSHIHFSNDKK